MVQKALKKEKQPNKQSNSIEEFQEKKQYFVEQMSKNKINNKDDNIHK